MKAAKIGELVDPVTTWNPSRSPDVEFEYIDLSAVDNGSKAVVGPTTVTGAEAPSRARQLVSAGDVLVSTVRPNLNAVAVVPLQLDGATASTGFTVLRPSEELDGRFLFHWVQSPAFIGDMVRKATGASYPAVSDRIVKDSAIPAPPLPEQRRIAAILDHADGLRTKRRQVLTHLDALTRSVFHGMFGTGVFDSVPLKEAIKWSSGKFLPAKEQRGGPHPVYGGNGINGSHDEYMLDEPQLVVGRVGAYCGAVHVTRPFAWVTDNALVATLLREDLTLDYLLHALTIANLNQYASVSGQPSISGGKIGDVCLPIPPLALQGEFAARADHIQSKIALVERTKSSDDELFTALQSRAFRGEL